MADTIIPNNSLVLYSHYWSMNGQTIINTYLYRMTLKPAEPGPIVYEAEAIAFTNLMADTGLAHSVPNLVTADTLFDTHDFQVIAPTRYYPLEFPLNTLGLQVGTALPQNVAQVITRKTAIASRKGVGSVHLPPPKSTAIVGGKLTNTQMDLLNTYAGEMLVVADPPFSSCTYTPVLWSRGTSTAAAQPLITAFAQRTGRVMGRRTVGRGI